MADFPIVDLTINHTDGRNSDYVTTERHAELAKELRTAVHERDELERRLDAVKADRERDRQTHAREAAELRILRGRVDGDAWERLTTERDELRQQRDDARRGEFIAAALDAAGVPTGGRDNLARIGALIRQRDDARAAADEEHAAAVDALAQLGERGVELAHLRRTLAHLRLRIRRVLEEVEP